VNSTELLVLNVEEVRRRSLKVWNGIPADRIHWKPDAQAMTCIEVVRHVLEGEFLYMSMLRAGKSVASEQSPFTSRPYTDIEAEVAFSAPYRRMLLDLLRSYTPDELSSKTVDRSDKGYVRTVGDFILRMAYHESVHTGQLLSYLRHMNAVRPDIWD
jgi:uncharacterized damage-inducible protein DinB